MSNKTQANSQHRIYISASPLTFYILHLAKQQSKSFRICSTSRRCWVIILAKPPKFTSILPSMGWRK